MQQIDASSTAVRTKTDVWLVGVWVALAACQSAEPAATDAAPVADSVMTPSNVKSINIIRTTGGRVDWSAATHQIAFDEKSGNGYYDVSVMTPDGANVRCLTCNASALPANKHKGNPTWDPTGTWIAFQVQKASTIPSVQGDFLASPGIGENNDLWVMDSTGTEFFPLTDVPLGKHGILHPQFSHSGHQLFWGQQLDVPGGPFGAEELVVADFVVNNGVPSVANIMTYRPGQKVFYESHGWSKDDSKVYFAASPDAGPSDYFMDAYSFDLQSQVLTNLTNSSTDWDELPVEAPRGDRVLWMTTIDNPAPGMGRPTLGDFWLMDTSGANKTRLTYFNGSGHPESGQGYSAADASWDVQTNSFVALLNISAVAGTAAIAVVELE